MQCAFENCGRDWAAAKKKMLEILGYAKASTVQRWIVLARDVPGDVRDAIQAKFSSLNQAYIVSNKYIVGKGEEGRFRMNSKYAQIALQLLWDQLSMGQLVSSTSFACDYCAPMKQLQAWEAAQIKTYGATASNFAAFARVVRSLQSDGGRQKILKCLQQRISLSGKVSENCANAGIEECRVVVQEMEKMKAGQAPGQGSASASAQEAACPPGGEGGPDAAASTSAADCPPDAKGGEGELDIDFVEEDQGVDPVLVKAKSLTDEELVHVSVHTEAQAFKHDIEGRVMPGHKAVVFIDAPTSKSKILHDFLNMRACFPQQFCLWITIGARFDLLSTLKTSMERLWPRRPVFVLLLGKEQQKARSKPTFALYMPMNVDEQVPTLFTCPGAKAMSSEGLRLRCGDCDCKHKPASSSTVEGGQDADAEQDIAPDDMEFEPPRV